MSMPARRIKAYAVNIWPGDYWWTVKAHPAWDGAEEIDGLRASCPCGCGASMRVAFTGRGDNGRTDHRFDCDVVQPSVSGLIESPCGWAGRLVKGRWHGGKLEAAA